MKRLFLIPMALIVLATILTVGVHAQTNNPQKVIARIPFAFTAGKASLPPGKYTITVLNPTSDRKILQIRSIDGRSSVLILTSTVQGNLCENAKLVFERYDDRYFFKQAQMAGEATSLAVVRSKAERKHMLASGGKQTVIVISAG